MAARRKKTAKKRTAGGAKKRPAAKRAARKRVVKKRATKPARKPAKRAARKRVVKKRAAKPARKPAPRAAAKRRPAAKRAFAPAFAPQKQGASAKDLLLFELERARVAVMSAVQGLSAGTAMRPVAEGKWSIHEIVLHLAVRDRVRLDEFESLLAGHPASWAHVTDKADEAAMNEAHLVPLRERSWDDALRLLLVTREELLSALRAVPAEPAAVWAPEHPFGGIMARLAPHDRGHAETIKNARIAG